MGLRNYKVRPTFLYEKRFKGRVHQLSNFYCVGAFILKGSSLSAVFWLNISMFMSKYTLRKDKTNKIQV